MNDELLEQISDLDSLAISNPIKYASEKHANRDWVLSADDVARVRPVNPDWFKEDRSGFFGKVGRGLSEAGSAMLDVPQEVKNLINSGGVALQDLVSPNMTESQMRTRLQTGFREMASIRANRQKQLELDELADSDIVNWSNMIGQVGLYALLGLTTGSAGVIGALSGAQAAGEINQSFMESYAEQSGDTTLQEYTPGIDPLIATSYGALAGWIESKLGVERLATGALARLAREGEFRALRQGLSSAVGEGAEESLQEFTGYVAGRMAGYDDRSESAAIKDALTAGLYGAILGGPTGAGLYYVNRARMINWFENRGLSHEQATTAANQVYDEAIADTMNEISANDSLRNYSGTEFNNLVDKVQSALVAAGWGQNNPGRSVADYARVVSADVANQVLRISGKSNLTTNEILNLGEIETDGNMVWLRPQNLQTVEQVQAKIGEIDERIKGINAELKQARADRAILQEDKEKSRQLRANLRDQRLKLAVLNRLLAKRRGDAVVERAELNRQKAELDRRAIQATNQDLANMIDSMRVANRDEDFVYVGNRRVPVNYRVVDMGQVRQSHIGGVANTNYGIKELQNRASRGTRADDAILRQRAQDFKPEFMVDSPNTQYGAPVVNKDGDVIAGNGRVETLRYVYEDNQTGADAYKERLQSMGFDVAGMERPILVREIADDLTTEQQIAIADASNVSEISAFDHASQAIQDSKLLQGTNGAIEWAQKLPITERQRLFLNNGKWDMRALNQRYNDALLAWMCNDDPRLFERIILSGKVSDKIISGLVQNGAGIVSFQTAHPESDLRGDIHSALIKASSLRNKSEFMEFVSTPDLSGVNEFPANSLLYNMVFSNTSGDINNFISAYMAKQEANTQGDNLLGEQVRFTKDDIYSQTLKQTYPDAWDGDTITNKNLLAVFISQQNQYAGTEQPNQLMQEQFDLANENTRLDDIYPAYDGETIEINGIERTVYNSNGERIAESAEALRNFYNWFGDSKVVDEQGRPLVVYHGAGTKFDTFRLISYYEGMTDNPKMIRPYAFFSSSKDVSKRFGKEVYPVYLKIENPSEFNESGANWNAISQIQWFENTPLDKDGIVVKNIKEGNTGGLDTATDFIVFENNQIKSTDNRGTFSPDTGNIYNQGRVQNGFYDSELQVIVLGRNFNTTTLPHEMSHFWLDTYFKLFKQAQRGEIQVSEQWLTEVKTLFNMLGINENQENLTRVQQERWAVLNEGVITGYAAIPTDCALPITEYLNWIPEKYKSILQIGYLDENGNVQRPVLDKAGVDFFNEWYGNITLPSLPTSPAQEKITNLRNSQGEIIPSDAQTIKDRETTMESAIREQKKADDELYKSVDESVPQPDKNAITAQVAKYYVPEQELLPEHESWFRPGRRTNAVKEMERVADKYVKQNPDKAREIALSNPLTTENDSGVDRESLIRAVMKADKIEKGSDLYATYENNIALSRSRAGTELGLSSRRGSYQMYLDAYREMSIAMEKKAAYKYAGRGADSVDKLNTDILELVNRYADRIFGDEQLDMRTAIAEMCAEADVKFAGNEDSTVFNQLDLTNLRTVRTKRAFVAYAEHLIRKDIVKAEPDTTMQGRLLEGAERAEKAAIDVNSDDKVMAAAGMKVLREWTNLVRSEDVDSTAWSKFINSYAPRAMLSGISTHATNVFSGTFEQPMIRAAIGAYYGKNIVPDDIVRQESDRIKFVYKNTLMNLTTMVSSQDPSLIHGEKYKPLDPDAKGWVKVYDAPMRALGAEDNLFRIPTYLDVAARMASRDSGGDVNKAIQLFKEYTRTQNKKVNGQENPYYAKRQEIINVAAMSVFTQNGKLAGALNKMRDALNNLTIFGRQIELGTAIAPFVKTPANIFASGMRAPFGAMRALYRKITGQPLDIQDAVDVAHSVGLLLIGLVAGLLMDYEPPYTGGKYDPDKPYDSIGIGGLWIKIDTLGVLETPLRLLLSTIHGELPKSVKGTVENIPLVGELVGANLDYLGNAPDRYISGLLYNQANKLIPTIARQVIKPIGHATVEDSVGLEDLDVLGWAGVETGIGRKIERSYGLDGGDLSFNDLVGVVWNRLKYYPN